MKVSSGLPGGRPNWRTSAGELRRRMPKGDRSKGEVAAPENRNTADVGDGDTKRRLSTLPLWLIPVWERCKVARRWMKWWRVILKSPR